MSVHQIQIACVTSTQDHADYKADLLLPGVDQRTESHIDDFAQNKESWIHGSSMEKGFSTTKEGSKALLQSHPNRVEYGTTALWAQRISKPRSKFTCKFQENRRLSTRGLAHFHQAIFPEIRFGITDDKFLWPSLEVTKNVSCDGLFFANSN